MAELCIGFLCGLRGFHVYKNVWTPILNENLNMVHESDNNHDRYAIRKRFPGQVLWTVVGHLHSEDNSVYIARNYNVFVCHVKFLHDLQILILTRNMNHIILLRYALKCFTCSYMHQWWSLFRSHASIM